MKAFFASCFSSAQQSVLRDLELRQQDPNPSLYRRSQYVRKKQEFTQDLKIVPNKFTLKGVQNRPGQRVNYIETVGIKQQKYNKWLHDVRGNVKMWNKIFQEQNTKNLT